MKILHKKNSDAGYIPTPEELELGEIAINTTDGIVYTKKDDGTPEVVRVSGEEQIQPNWQESDIESPAFIQNKPDDITDLSLHNLNELSDIDQSFQVDDYLKWNGTNWVGETIPDPVLNLDDLNDVDVTGATDGQFLAWDATSGDWIPTTASGSIPSLEDLTDVNITSVTTDDYIKWNGAEWVNTPPETVSIDDLDDVDTTTTVPADGQVLTWDNTSGNWVPENTNGGTPTGLEKITESGNTGWRLLGRDPANYGDIGSDAVDFSYSMGPSTTRGATGRGAHAIGGNTTASGEDSHAEGFGTTASSFEAHAEGYNTIASGYDSHSEGAFTTASGYASHAEGFHTVANNLHMHAAGVYNTGTATDTIHETGIGTSDTNRKNAFEIYTDGRLVAPELTQALINSPRSLTTKEYVDANAGGGASELEKITENGNTGWRLLGRDPANYGNTGSEAVDLSYAYISSGSGSSGAYGATGDYSHAEGYNATASGVASHAEGYNATASGGGTHAEGFYATASGHYSHAEGWRTRASGQSSHAEGLYTIAQNDAMHAAGKYNVGTSTLTIHETGIGTAINDRRNAFEIHTDGRLIAPEYNVCDVPDNEKNLVTYEYLIKYTEISYSVYDIEVTDPNQTTYTFDALVHSNTVSFEEQDVFLNGILKRDGSSYDYTISVGSRNGNAYPITLTFNSTLTAGDWIRFTWMFISFNQCDT